MRHLFLISFTNLTCTSDRFRWVYCQLEYLANCLPGRIQRALDELPESLDGIYERTLREIEESKWEYVQQLLFCVTVACRPLRVEELAEILAFDFKLGTIPKFHEDWRLRNPVEAVLSTCPSLLAVVNVETSLGTSRVVQFSHFSVREFLTSRRLAEGHDNISRRYHISMSPAHTFVTQACLGVLLHFDKDITSRTLTEFPLAEYAAQHWFEHARFGGVSENVVEGMRQLFDRTKPHLSIWLWIHDPTLPHWKRSERPERPSSPCGTPLHYAAFCGLRDIAEILANEHPLDVNSQSLDGGSSPLHLASLGGHTDLARMLVERGAEVSARYKDGRTALHLASLYGHVYVARMLVEGGADVSAKTKHGSTALHFASYHGHVDLSRMLIEYNADVLAQRKDGWAVLHLASLNGHLDLARMLVERGADVSARHKDGWTALHVASLCNHVDLAQVLVERGADVSAKTEDGWTALHLALENGHEDLARMLVARGIDVSVHHEDGRTALHVESRYDQVGLTQILAEDGADVPRPRKGGLHRITKRCRTAVRTLRGYLRVSQ